MTGLFARIRRHLLARAIARLVAAGDQIPADQLGARDIGDIVQNLAVLADAEIRLLTALRDRCDQLHDDHAAMLTAWQHDLLDTTAATVQGAVNAAHAHHIGLRTAAAALREARSHL